MAETGGSTAGTDQAGTVRVVSMAVHTAAHCPVAATRTAACYPDLLHWREFIPCSLKTLPVKPTVSTHDRKYDGAPCFRTDDGRFA